jgi:hypothetical protein
LNQFARRGPDAARDDSAAPGEVRTRTAIRSTTSRLGAIGTDI